MMPSSSFKAPLPPRSVIGILGSGQLGKMLAQAASRLGFRTHVYGDDSGPAFDVAGSHSVGHYESLHRLDEFASTVDVVTYEFENVPVAAAEHLSTRVPVRPNARALSIAQDRIAEKTFIRDTGIAVAPFASLAKAGDLDAAREAMAAWTRPGIMKTARFGYDGKGQVNVATPDEVRNAYLELGEVPVVLEQRLTFQCEISVLVVRALDGTVATYDIPRNEHRDGILRRSTVPSGLPRDVEDKARAMAISIVSALDYIGVMGVELFYLGPEAEVPLVVNEIAPRVHNSGHWTMDACLVGQFENHIRAVAGWPLGATDRHSNAVMENLIGHEADAWQTLAGTAGAGLHLYGKREARPGRKMGHVNHLSARTDHAE
ncbi:MAG: 5-(carboxyamino)imidazole ribonucleotide synthase [Hyphomicrobiaceae bacterium]